VKEGKESKSKEHVDKEGKADRRVKEANGTAQNWRRVGLAVSFRTRGVSVKLDPPPKHPPPAPGDE